MQVRLLPGPISSENEERIMYCKICGDHEENKPKWIEGKWVEYYPSKYNTLCRPCAAETPDKMGKEEFIVKYFEGDDTVPYSVSKEFYEDYCAFTGSFGEYVESTRDLA